MHVDFGSKPCLVHALDALIVLGLPFDLVQIASVCVEWIVGFLVRPIAHVGYRTYENAKKDDVIRRVTLPLLSGKRPVRTAEKDNVTRRVTLPLCLIAVAYYPSYLAHLASIVQRISASRPLDLLSIVINGTNISPQDTENNFDGLARKRIIHQHDNSGLEFGAYQAGLDFLKSSYDSDFI